MRSIGNQKKILSDKGFKYQLQNEKALKIQSNPALCGQHVTIDSLYSYIAARRAPYKRWYMLNGGWQLGNPQVGLSMLEVAALWRSH